MKKLITLFLLIPIISISQVVKGEKIFSIKVAVGEWQSSVGEYLNLKTIYAPYAKGVFEGIAEGKVLPIGGDFPLYYLENDNTYWRFRTSSKKYKYLTDVMGVGFGSVLNAESEYHFQHDIYDITLN